MRRRLGIPLLSFAVFCLTLAALASSVGVQPLGSVVSQEPPPGILGVAAEVWVAIANIGIIAMSAFLLARER